LGVFVVEQALRRLPSVVSGEFSPVTLFSPVGLQGTAAVGAGTEWCDAEVLRLLRRRSLAALRREIEPVSPQVLARFLPQWHQVGSSRAGGVEAVASAIEQLQGVPVPASALERLILSARVADYSPSYVDELCAAGDLVWAGAGAIGEHDGWVALPFPDAAPPPLPPTGDAHRA